MAKKKQVPDSLPFLNDILGNIQKMSNSLADKDELLLLTGALDLVSGVDKLGKHLQESGLNEESLVIPDGFLDKFDQRARRHAFFGAVASIGKGAEQLK